MARKIKVDLTNVEAFQRVSEGIHRARIYSIDETQSQGGDDMLKIAFEVTEGADKGNRVFDNIVLTDKALWKLKSLLQTIGMKSDGKLAIDLDSMVGKQLEINVTHEEYNGQLRARVAEFLKISSASSIDTDDTDWDDEDEEEPKPQKAAKSLKAEKKAATKPTKKKSEPEEVDDWDDDDDWDDEEEEEKPRKPAKKTSAKSTKKAAPAKKSEPEESDDDDWDDDDWEED